jgi:hypothetical protein
MDQREFYEQLADQLIDNPFDSVRLCDRPSYLDKPGVPPRSGIGSHLLRTKGSARVRAVPGGLHSRSKESAVSALLRQLTCTPLDWMTALGADRPGLVTPRTTVVALA